MAGLLEYTKNGQVTEPPLYRFMKGNVQSFLNSIPDPSGLTREEQLNLAANVTPTIGLLGTFIGKGSKLWNSTTNDVAKALEKEGLAPETIWSQTGNVKAPDGKWRQEISDAEAVTTFPKRNVMGTVMPMEKRLSNENLYQAYPELRKMDLELTPKNSPSAGAFNSNWVELNASEAGLPNTKSILLHELQHAIQQKENFARGGNPKDFAKNIESQKLYSDANILSRLQAETNDIKKAVDSFKERFKREPMFGSESIALSGLSPDEILAKKYSILSPDENYRRLFGEAESRLTENRIPLTQEQRLQYYPYAQGQYGLDVPYNELIVKGLLD
jgi:hypothetical protein